MPNHSRPGAHPRSVKRGVLVWDGIRESAIARLHAESHRDYLRQQYLLNSGKPMKGIPSGDCAYGRSCGRLAKATAQFDCVVAVLAAVQTSDTDTDTDTDA